MRDQADLEALRAVSHDLMIEIAEFFDRNTGVENFIEKYNLVFAVATFCSLLTEMETDIILLQKDQSCSERVPTSYLIRATTQARRRFKQIQDLSNEEE